MARSERIRRGRPTQHSIAGTRFSTVPLFPSDSTEIMCGQGGSLIPPKAAVTCNRVFRAPESITVPLGGYFGACGRATGQKQNSGTREPIGPGFSGNSLPKVVTTMWTVSSAMVDNCVPVTAKASSFHTHETNCKLCASPIQMLEKLGERHTLPPCLEYRVILNTVLRPPLRLYCFQYYPSPAKSDTFLSWPCLPQTPLTTLSSSCRS